MLLKLSAVGLASAALLPVFAADAATVGSASFATQRSCTSTAATANCDGSGPGQQINNSQYGGGAGVGGLNYFSPGAGNKAWSQVLFDGSSDLPTIRGFTVANASSRVNINAFAFQTYTYTGATPLDFSITGALHIVNSSNNPGGGALPGGAIYSSYVGIWDPSAITGLTTAQQLFNTLFYAPCGAAGVRGAAFGGSDLPGGELTAAPITTAACAPGSLTLTTGQQVLVVAGMQLPVNRGGFADATATFTTRLGDDLPVEVKTQLEQSLNSAIAQGAPLAVPEPASWAMMIGGFGLVGAAMRRRPALKLSHS